MIVKAYAKINIRLRIVGRREDGFHLLEGKMQALPDLYDVLEIAEADETSVTCNIPGLDCGKSNLVCKALDLLGKKARVHIEKHIPVAAGLAGGSADAAAVLFAFGGSYEDAAKLGSDVPFSLMAIRHQGRVAALASGTGTVLTETEVTQGRIVTFTPDIAVSTPLVYKEYDRMPMDTGTNDLQPAAIRLFPEIQQVIDRMKNERDEKGNLPILVQQSGSGPTVFAIYKE